MSKKIWALSKNEKARDKIKLSKVLELCKANRYTYYNLDDSQIQYFKKQYNHLLKKKDLYIDWDMRKTLILKKQLETKTDYIAKNKAMEYINFII